MARLNIGVNPPKAEESPLPPPPAADADMKVQKIQEDLDLLKTSIKKLLIDIRDRLNEKDNPFLRPGRPVPSDLARDEESTAPDAGEEDQLAGTEDTPLAEAEKTPEDAFPASQKSVQEELASMLRGKIPPPGAQRTGEKLRLRKVHRLFGWTSKIINRYGHDRLEILIQAYTSMGYLTDDMATQIREIGRLLPASLGELHVIGPDEFVSELYILNRILDPKDNTLDEDMIEVLMTHRVQSPVAVPRKSGKDADQVFEWIDSLDRT